MAQALKKEDINVPKVSSAPKYIPIETILHYKLEKRLTDQDIADLVGCTRTAISKRLKPYKEDIEALRHFKKNKGDVLALHQRRMLKHLTSAKLKKASPRDLTTCFGILYDKEQQERGGGDNKNQISIILNLACQSHEKVIEVKANKIVDKPVDKS